MIHQPSAVGWLLCNAKWKQLLRIQHNTVVWSVTRPVQCRQTTLHVTLSHMIRDVTHRTYQGVSYFKKCCTVLRYMCRSNCLSDFQEICKPPTPLIAESLHEFHTNQTMNVENRDRNLLMLIQAHSGEKINILGSGIISICEKIIDNTNVCLILSLYWVTAAKYGLH